MDITMFSMDGLRMFLKWMHFFFGILWIGHLYYFNFTQGTFMSAADAPSKSAATRILVPRALYWFRWGAMWTFVSGVCLLGLIHNTGGAEAFKSNVGIPLLIGALFGVTMWYNVWFIIWPAQKIIIKSAEQVAAGGQAIAEAATLAPKSTLASRTNTLMSIPLLFFMGAGRTLPFAVTPESNLTLLWVLVLIIWGALEFNAIKGKTGPMTTVKGVITSGFVLTAILYAVVEICLHI